MELRVVSFVNKKIQKVESPHLVDDHATIGDVFEKPRARVDKAKTASTHGIIVVI